MRHGPRIETDPTPIMFEADNFRHFDDCYGKNFDQETDKYLPSKTQKFKEHGMSFSPTQQALKCTKEVIQCCHCLKWRCINEAKKITNEEKQTAVKLIENLL